MYERVKKNYYLIKNIENSRLAAIFSVPMFYHKFYVFSSKSTIYKYSDIVWVVHINQRLGPRIPLLVDRPYRTHLDRAYIV